MQRGGRSLARWIPSSMSMNTKATQVPHNGETDNPDDWLADGQVRTGAAVLDAAVADHRVPAGQHGMASAATVSRHGGHVF